MTRHAKAVPRDGPHSLSTSRERDKLNTKMANPKNHGAAWDKAANQQFNKLVSGNTPTRLIAYKMGRTEDAVRSHAHDVGKSLKPTNQRPYGTHK